MAAANIAVEGVRSGASGFFYRSGEGYSGETDLTSTSGEQIMNKKEDPARMSSNEAKTILLAEDEEIVKQFLQKSMQREGYRVLTASNGEEALARFMENMEDISLVVTDVVMPIKSGIELHNEINLVKPETRFLFISGLTSDYILMEEGTDGRIGFITKPFEKKVVMDKIRELLES